MLIIAPAPSYPCHMQAKCGAPLRVELVDDTGACVMEGLPHGMQLEIHVLNGEKYKVGRG